MVMALPLPPRNPNQPIPNSPFYSPLTQTIQGSTGPLIVGSGLTVDFSTGTITSSGGGGGGAVGQIIAGTGITVSPAGGTGLVTVSLTTPAVTSVSATAPLSSSGGVTPAISLLTSGVTAGTYSNTNITVDSFGRITAAASGISGSVTSIDTGTGLTGGPITASGTISLANTAVAAGPYTYGSFTVDQQGRLTAASSGINPSTTVTAPITNAGTAIAPVIGVATASTGQLGVVQVGTNIDVATGVISVKSATTAQSGIVQLNDTVASTSVTAALTANQGKNLQDQISALAVATNLTLAGTFDAAASQMLTVTAAGTAASFVIGSDIPAAAAGNLDYFVIITTGGSYSPPGGGGPYLTIQGDWLQSNGTAWQYLNVGADLPAASTTSQGIVELATVGETQTGTSTTLAVTPAGAAGTYLAQTVLNAKGALISATAANTPSALGVGADGFVLTACAAAPAGLCWVANSAGSAAIPCAVITGKGAVLTGTNANTPVALPVGAEDQVLAVCLACTTGLAWKTITSAAIPCACLTAKGALVTATAASTPVAITVGTDGQVLTACAVSPSGLCWATASVPAIPCACITGKGTLITGTAADTPVALSVGTDGQFLLADSTCANGLRWATECFVNDATFTAKGEIVAGTGLAAFAPLVVGANNTYLVADSTCTTGLKWATNTALTCSLLTAKGTLVTATAASTPASLAVGTNGQILTACSTCTDGIAWITNAAIPCANLLAKGALISASAAGTPANLAVGTNGQLLIADSACTPGIKWGGLDLLAASPTSYGTLLGCTTATDTALGCSALSSLSSGTNNVALGASAGSAITTGSQNVAIGPNSAVASATGSCQLALGFSATGNWLTGDSSKNITPGAGIKDCAGSLGTAGQALTSTATALKWDGPYTPNCCYSALGAMVVGCAANCPYTISPAVADRYTLVSCASCPGGVFWSPTLSILGETAVGAVNFFAGQTPPVGWLIADGSLISRTGYAALFGVIGTTYGAGDGSTTFQLPDMRGMFPRGWDAAGGTSRNCDPGRAFGSTQQDALQNITGTFKSFDRCYAPATGAFCTYGQWNPEILGSSTSGFWGSCNCLVIGNVARTANQTRPMNVALMPCIKYENTTAPLSPSSGIPCSCITGQGALLTGNAACSPQALPVGVPGSLLMTNTGCALGIEWAAPGTNGQVLMACSTCATGNKWQTGAVGNWISAGTVQSVGFISSGGGAVIPTTTQANNISYRQLGPKTYEVVGTLRFTSTTGGANGTGLSYILTLPAGLQFDTTLPFQTTFTGAFTDTLFPPSYFLPGSTLAGSQDAAYMLLGGIVPLSATTYRIGIKSSTSITGAYDFWNPGYFELVRALGSGRSWSFQFQTP